MCVVLQVPELSARAGGLQETESQVSLVEYRGREHVDQDWFETDEGQTLTVTDGRTVKVTQHLIIFTRAMVYTVTQVMGR